MQLSIPALGTGRAPTAFGLVAVAILCASSASLAARAPSYAESAKLVANDGSSSDDFGYAVAIAGATVVIGAVDDKTKGELLGSAYVFERTDPGGDWSQIVKLVADDGEGLDRFGWAVDISGDWIIVGAPEDDNIASNTGAVYFFGRDAGGPGSWGAVAKVRAPDGEVGDRFGSSVSIDGETAIVGAPEDDDLGLGSGSVYVLERDAGGPSKWGVVAKLLAEDGKLIDGFGVSVGLDGERAIVGTSGADAAYIRERHEGGSDNWGEVARLSRNGAGGAVDLSDDIVVVGAYLDDEERGSAGVFRRNLGGSDNWGLAEVLTAPDGARGDRFGYSVSIDGDTATVGAYFDNDNDEESGSAYVFGRHEGGAENWGKIAKTIASDGSSRDEFGWAVAIGGGTLAIGARFGPNGGLSAGATYIFDEIVVDPVLALIGNCPGEVTFDYSGGTPLGQAAIAVSSDKGSAPIQGGVCAGTESGLGLVNLLALLPVDENGEATLDATLPFFACGLQLQAIDLVSCATSNVTTPP